MAHVQMRSLSADTFQLIIDGQDVSQDVLRHASLEIPAATDADPFPQPVLVVRYPVDGLDVELDDVQVQRG